MSSTSPIITILNLPIGISIDGTEWMPTVQSGTTKRITTGQIISASVFASSNIGLTAPYVLTSSAPPAIPNARKIAVTSPISLTDGGAGGSLTIGLNSSLVNSSYAIPNPGVAGQFAYYSSTNAISGSSLVTISSGTITIGSSSIASVVVSSSGPITLGPLATISSGTITLGSALSPGQVVLFSTSGGNTATIQGNSAASVITAFAGTDQMVGRATVDTLTGKTFDTAGSSNTFKIGGTTISTASNLLDTLGSSQGSILYRSSTVWAPLSVGSSTQILFGGTIPQWGANTVGTVTNIGTANIVTGGPITSSGTIGVSATMLPNGRITLSSPNNPIMLGAGVTSSIAYYTPYNGNIVPIYDGTNVIPTFFTEVSQNSTDTTKSPSAATATTVYDLFVWNDSGTIRCTRGSSWATANTRASSGGLTRVNGVFMNATSITNGPAAQRGVYVGTVATNASTLFEYTFGAAASGGVKANLLVWNMYNRVVTATTVTDNGTVYTYTTNGFRPGRNSDNNSVSVVYGLIEDSIQASYISRIDAVGATNASGRTSIGLNSTNNGVSPRNFISNNSSVNTLSIANPCAASVYPSLGSNTLYGLESGDGTNANNFNSDQNAQLTVTIRN